MSVTAIPKLPYKPTKPYIQPRNTQAMTIAIGLKACDGVVFCSDSQITIPQYMKYTGPKVFTLSSNKNDANKWAIGFTYSGDPERMHRVFEQMSDVLCKKDVTVNKDLIRTCFEKSLGDVRSTIINTNYESIDILCGGSIGTSSEPFMFCGKSGSITESKELVLLGCGDSSLSRYLEGMFPDGRLLMDASTALVSGAYLIEQAKLYVDGCGGNSQISLVTSGQVKTFRGAALKQLVDLAVLMDEV